MAASPIPGAAYIVANMSSMSVRSRLSTVFTASDLTRNRLSGMMRMSRTAMSAI